MEKLAISLLKKGFKFIEGSIDIMFGDIRSMEIYRLCGDIIQMKANMLFER